MILLTGGTGYVGSHLAAALRAAGESVRLLRHGDAFATLPEGWRLDLAAPEQVAQLPPLPATALIHLGGLIDIRLLPNPAGASLPPIAGATPAAPLTRANVRTTEALADFCNLRGIPMVFASSQTVYGMPERELVDESAPLRPLEPYAESKVAAENLLRTASGRGLAVTMLRFPGVYGGDRRSGAVQGMAKAAVRDGRIRVIAEFPMPFDVLHVDDVVRGFLAAMARPAQGWRCLNLGSGETCSLTLLAEAIARLVPGCLVEPPQVAQPPLRLAVEAARRALNWTAVPRDERLSQLIAAVRTGIVDAA